MEWILVLGIVILLAVAALAIGRCNQKKRLEAARKELFENIGRFSGCFQPLYDLNLMSNSEMEKYILDMWKKKVEALPNLEYLFNKKCSHREEWFQLLDEWGIKHDERDEILTIAPEHESLYLFSDVYEMGNKAKVMRPAWWYVMNGEKKCLEMGIAMIE
ncbi:MAG: hypothetical protein IJ315_09550 [Firmicutes bacterium]|nr:hypothetical protein [Bacillota bacterium]